MLHRPLQPVIEPVIKPCHKACLYRIAASRQPSDSSAGRQAPRLKPHLCQKHNQTYIKRMCNENNNGDRSTSITMATPEIMAIEKALGPGGAAGGAAGSGAPSTPRRRRSVIFICSAAAWPSSSCGAEAYLDARRGACFKDDRFDVCPARWEVDG